MLDIDLELFKIRASNIHKCHKCLLKSITEPKSDEKSLPAELGTIIHNGFIDTLAKHEGLNIADREKELCNDVFTGHIDGAIDENTLFELKTISTFLYKEINEPLERHIDQTLIYSHLGGFKKVLFCYLNRDSGEYKFFNVSFDSEYMKKRLNALIFKAKKVIEYANVGLKADDIENPLFQTCDKYCEFENNTVATPVKTPAVELSSLDEANHLLTLKDRYNILSNQKKDMELELKNISEKIKTYMVEKDISEIRGFAVFYKNTRASIDTNALKENEPNIYEKYLKTSESSYFKIKN